MAQDPVQEVARRPDLCPGKQHAITFVPVSQLTKGFCGTCSLRSVAVPLPVGKRSISERLRPRSQSVRASCTLTCSLGLPRLWVFPLWGSPISIKNSVLLCSLFSLPCPWKNVSALGRGFDSVVCGPAHTRSAVGSPGRPPLSRRKSRFKFVLGRGYGGQQLKTLFF